MCAIKNLFLAILFIVTFIVSPCVYAKEYHSFVDEMVDSPILLEEDPADEFINEKRELNRMILEAGKNKIEDQFLLELYSRVQSLETKITDKYGEVYLCLDLSSTLPRFLSVCFPQKLDEIFQSIFENEDVDSLKQKLRDENTWKAIDLKVNGFLKNSGLNPEQHFQIDRKYVNVSKKVLGESDPITIKHTLRLINDYSILGDSKTALEMSKDLYPKIKKAFGEKSSEIAEIFELMANDYKVLGNYAKSEECFLKAIEINKSLYGEEGSSKLLSDIVGLINLTRCEGTLKN